MAIVEKNIVDNLLASLQKNASMNNAIDNKLVEKYKGLDIPSRRHEDWKYLDVSSVFEKSYGVASILDMEEENIDSLVEKQELSSRIVFLNGIFSKTLSRVHDTGISVQSLGECSRKDACGYNASFDSTKVSDRGSFELLNTIFANEGVAIRVARNVTVQHPVQVLFVHNGNQGAFINTRNIIVCEAFSNVSFEAHHIALGQSNHTSNIVTELLVKEQAQVSYTQIVDESEENVQFNSMEVLQEQTSNASIHTFQVNGGIIRNSIRVSHRGEGCETTLNGLYIPNRTQQFDNFTLVNHDKPHCTTRELYKGVASHKSTGIFVGRIYVAKDAQKTLAYQSNRNLLLSPEATIHSKPQLEIWADDVSCTHGSSIGQLNQDQLFYCQSRGISKDEAIRLLLQSFVAEVVNKIPSIILKGNIISLVEAKLLEGVSIR